MASNNPLSAKVQNKWWDFIKIGENEINVLFELSESDLNSIDEDIAKHILAFRNGYVSYFPGGAGEYGKPIISFSKEEKEAKDREIDEKYL